MRKFHTLDEVVEQLSVSMSQMRALVRSGNLEGIEVGARDQ